MVAVKKASKKKPISTPVNKSSALGKKSSSVGKRKLSQPLSKGNTASKQRKVSLSKLIYNFGEGKADGQAKLKNLLGGKGANLAEMARIGLPVPSGFTITTEVCTYFSHNNHTYPASFFSKELPAAIQLLEKRTGKKFGSVKNPLLVSVRSGARASMPGMMDTVLNLGLNDETTEGLARLTGNDRFAWDCYRRFIQMYGDVVMGMKPLSKKEHNPFEAAIDEKKLQRGIKSDVEMNTDDLKDLVARFKRIIRERAGKDFPTNPMDQLKGAISAVFGSWNNERAIVYRKLNNIPHEWGTACNVQAMAFGNLGESSGTGVAFTRDPSTGENIFYGEYLMNAQGEDVVSGARTPLKISELQKQNPLIYGQLEKIRKTLEKHFRDMNDIEFTIEDGKLFMLQCRVGKRTGFAAIKIAMDMKDEKLITEKEALLRIEPEQLNQLLRPIFDSNEKKEAVTKGRFMAKGLNAGPGAASGKVYFHASDAEEAAKRGERVVLVRLETSPEDIRGMAAAEGILTARGGMTSHAALVARQMGKVCVAGCGELEISYEHSVMTVQNKAFRIKEGDFISIDGTTGEIFEGEIKTKPSEVLQVLFAKTLKPEDSEIFRMYERLMKWADRYRTLKIRTNADQPDQALTALAFGAEGIGLCRTEHMFFGGDRIDEVRRMIMAQNEEERRAALKNILPYQRVDFYGIFKAMNGYAVTIRLLDPPLHEFLPHTEKDQRLLGEKLHKPYEMVKARVESLAEFNPMLGFRGCRLGILYPEITEMQVRALLEAACNAKKDGFKVYPEIMVPLVGDTKEFSLQAEIIHRVAQQVFEEKGHSVDYIVGTMIEVPRAALLSGEIAKVADFYSFGTNDLTQMTLGLSRDDAGRFLPAYLEKEIYPRDPFQAIDRVGVGRLMKLACEDGRAVKPKLKLGICGEHGGETSSVEFCHQLGLDYVSCSPFRVPIARFAAARATILNEK
ncbi:MAG: pyruvate, phosphate dikinase [Chloroherpetonaceae bacterium]|nr:pyruvate, phosphate dikinase [Chloroherpetonaceae bacterium]